MKVSRRIAVSAARGLNGSLALAAARVAQAESIRSSRDSFRPLTGAEIEGNPLDPQYERIHRPHVFLAQFDRPRR